ncbi:Protease inhibitor protein, partial [Globisporangium splendens]
MMHSLKTIVLACAVLAALAAHSTVRADTTTCVAACPKNRTPCSTNSTTLTVASEGECPASSSSTSGSNASCFQELACLSIIDYASDSDGKTYNNACELRMAKCENPSLTQVSTGEYKTDAATADTRSSGAGCETTKCTTVFQSVCGSNSVTYTNKCHFKNA